MVAKVRRLSSPPLALGLCDKPRAVALRRLADILCCGYWSHSNFYFRHLKWSQKEDPEPEWKEYHQVVRQELGSDILETFEPQLLPRPTEQPTMRVSFHNAEMNSRPYCVARVGAVLGAPAAVYLTPPEEKESSALHRLGDVFQLGTQGRCFADFAATLRETGLSVDAIRSEWNNCARAVVWEVAHRASGN